MRSLCLILLLSGIPTALAGEIRIAVAANFKQTASAINALFERDSGHTTKLSSGSTGTLHSQIIHGAPYDIFFSADRHSPEKLEAEGFGTPGKRFCYARGQLVLAGGSGSLIDLANPDLSLAIANPVTAPYGRAATDILARPEYSNGSTRKMVRANNVAQAYQYWYSQAVDLALVAQSLAPGEGLEIPQAWYAPIEQEVILLRRGRSNPAAQSYLDFLKSKAVQSLIAASGYGACK